VVAVPRYIKTCALQIPTKPSKANPSKACSIQSIPNSRAVLPSTIRLVVNNEQVEESHLDIDPVLEHAGGGGTTDGG
jgi:hypothetical protein